MVSNRTEFGEKFLSLVGGGFPFGKASSSNKKMSMDQAIKFLKPTAKDLDDYEVTFRLFCIKFLEPRYMMMDGKLDEVWLVSLNWIDLTTTYVLCDRESVEILKDIEKRRRGTIYPPKEKRYYTTPKEWM